MGVSYLALFEYRRDGEQRSAHKFFTDARAKKDSPKTYAEADEWLTKQLVEHGAYDCRASISQTKFVITG